MWITFNLLTFYNMMTFGPYHTKNMFLGICRQQRHRSACAYTDQDLYCPVIESLDRIVAVCIYPEDTFSHVMAHLTHLCQVDSLLPQLFGQVHFHYKGCLVIFLFYHHVLYT